MALELFKTFVISRLISDGHVYNVKNATKMIEKKDPVVWDILEQLTAEHSVMLNRAPTLHRLGIQAFMPKLIEGKALQIHPLVCQAFNADFDGDQMAVHVPLSTNSRREAAEIMLSSKNLLKPASGDPIVTPRFDMILGCYYITKIEGIPEKIKIFSGKNEAIMAWQTGVIDVHTRIKIRISDKVQESDTQISERGENTIVETCVGRVVFNNILPDELRFINATIDAKKMAKIVARVFKDYGSEITANVLDRIKALGFQYATLSGLSIGIDDISIPDEKKALIDEAQEKIDLIEAQMRRGLITQEEKSLKTIDLWNSARNKIEKKTEL
jgi:DNA-directed RNA polymerase subunit beta'